MNGGNGGNSIIGAFGQFTLKAVDGMNGLLKQISARPEDYESDAKAMLRANPDAVEVVVLDNSGNFFDFVMNE